MAAVYYLDLDTAGHYHGPLSYQTNQTVFDLDRTMQFLNKQIMVRGFSLCELGATDKNVCIWFMVTDTLCTNAHLVPTCCRQTT